MGFQGLGPWLGSTPQSPCPTCPTPLREAQGKRPGSGGGRPQVWLQGATSLPLTPAQQTEAPQTPSPRTRSGSRCWWQDRLSWVLSRRPCQSGKSRENLWSGNLPKFALPFRGVRAVGCRRIFQRPLPGMAPRSCVAKPLIGPGVVGVAGEGDGREMRAGQYDQIQETASELE